MGVHFHIPPEERKVAPWIALLMLVAFLAALLPIPKALLWDEAVNLSTAENLGRAAPYYSEISRRPPLLPVLLRLGATVMRMDTFGHLLAAAFFAAGILVLYLLGSTLFDRTAGLISAVLLAACPFFVHFSHKVMTDVPAAVLAAASMLCFFLMAGDEDEDPGWLTAISAGVLLAAAFLMQFVLGALFLVPVYLVLVNRVAFRPLRIAAAAALATLAPYLLWAQIWQGGAWKPFAQAMFGAGGSATAAGPLYYLTALWTIAGPVALVGIALYLALGMGRRKGDNGGRDIPLLIWFGVVFLPLSLSEHKETRYLLPAIPVLMLYAGAGYARCRRRKVTIAAALMACTAFGYQATHLPYFRGVQELGESQLLAYAENTRQAADFLRPLLHPTDIVYTSSLYPIVAWYSKAQTVALWPWTDEFYAEYPKNMKRDGYLVYYKGFNKEPNQDWLDHRLEFRMVKDFPDVTIYAYSRPVPLPSKPESAEGADGVGTVRPAGSRDR